MGFTVSRSARSFEKPLLLCVILLTVGLLIPALLAGDGLIWSVMRSIGIVIGLIVGLLVVLSIPDLLGGLFRSRDENPRRDAFADVDRLLYRFQDASTPPSDHRSYEISVDARQVRFSIDCYGEELTKTALPSSQAQFDALLNICRQAGLGEVPATEQETAVGGSSQYISCFAGERRILHGASEPSGGTLLTGDCKAVIAAIKALVPDLEEQIAATYD